MSQDVLVLTRENTSSLTRRMPLIARASLNILKNLEYGSLVIRWPDGTTVRIDGKQPGAHAHINLKSLDLPTRVFKNGDVGVGESFMEGEWDSPDITSVLLLFCQNRHLMIARQRNFLSGLFLKFVQWRNTNTKSGSKRNISAHYDLGNEFYSRWLDASMTYSSAIFSAEDMSLEQAQAEKYANLAREMAAGENDHILEIGCGWGGFAEFAAKEIGCKVTGLTISREQLEFAQERIFKAGLNEKVDIIFRDYREETGTYDRIASIEMFEAVGEKYWSTYFSTLQHCLKPGGSAGLQIITIQDHLFESYRKSADFIQRYIFPGGMLPSPSILKALGDEHGLSQTKEQIFGHDYADTLADWRRQFNAAWPSIAPLGFDDRFKRMWQFYLYYCEAGFRSENIDVRQVFFQKPA